MPNKKKVKERLRTNTITNSFPRKNKNGKNKHILKAIEDLPHVAVARPIEEIQGQQDNSVMPELRNAEQCSVDEAVQYLRNFDLRCEFGPCLGINRSERYERALDWGLNPPKTVILVIRRFQATHPDIENNVWTKHPHIVQ